MHHLTLLTGHSRWSPRNEVSDEMIALIRPVVRIGAGPLGTTGWFLQMIRGESTGGVAFECHHGAHRRNGGLWVASCYMAWTGSGADEMWAAAMTHHPMIKTGIKRPRLPWLAVAIMPAAVLMPRPDMMDLMMEVAGLERCIAWAVLSDVTAEAEGA